MPTPLTASTPDEGGGEPAGVRRAHEHLAGAVGDRAPDGVVVAGRGEAAAHEHDLSAGQALDLVEDVRADDHRAALVAQPLEELDERLALDGVGAVERLVEHEDLGVAHERGGHLRALAHPLAEAADPAVGHVEQADRPQGALGRGAVAHAVEGGGVAHELTGREHARIGVLFRDEGDDALNLAARARVEPLDADGAGAQRQHPGDGPHERRLARAVRAEQARDPGAEGAGQLGQRHLRAEPHRRAVQDDRRLLGERGVTRWRRRGQGAHGIPR